MAVFVSAGGQAAGRRSRHAWLARRGGCLYVYVCATPTVGGGGEKWHQQLHGARGCWAPTGSALEGRVVTSVFGLLCVTYAMTSEWAQQCVLLHTVWCVAIAAV